MAITITPEEKHILKSVSIPPRPEALLQFSEECKNPEPDIGIISNILQSDIGISAAILQVTNSSAFRRAKEIESIDQAIMMLGLKRLIPLVKAVALKAAVGDDPSMQSFWEEQTVIAQFCTKVCKILNKPNLANHAYMLGLFHAVGIVILNQHFESFNKIVEYANKRGWDTAAQAQLKYFKTNHATIGALLAQQWRLPKVMINIIYYQHDVEGIYKSTELDRLGLDLLSILKIARHCTYINLKPDSEDPDWDIIKDDLMDHLGMEEEQLNEILETLTE